MNIKKSTSAPSDGNIKFTEKMKIAFLYIGSENLGLEYLSAILKKQGHEVKLFYDPSLFDDKFIFSIPPLNKLFDIKNTITKSLIEFEPHLIGFSIFTEAYRWALDLASEIKRSINAPIVFGGVHVTMVPEKVIKEKVVDIVNIGEGFDSLPELAAAIKQNKDYSGIKNLWVKKGDEIFRNEIRGVYSNLDKLPFPDKELFGEHFNIRDNYSIMSSFGCPYQCTYCSNESFLNLYSAKGGFIRRRSIENVIQELKIARKRYKIKVVNFMDDIFTTNKKWITSFLHLYKKEIKVPYRVISHPKHVDDQIIKLLKDTGCYRVEFGVQSVNEEVRKKILKRNETNEEIGKAFSLCEKHKLNYMIDHMHGLPTEDRRHQLEAAHFYSNFKPARIANFWLVYYPKAAINNIALEKKLLSHEDIGNIEGGHITSYHDGGSVTDTKKRVMFENFAVFFLLIPLLSMMLNKKLARSKLLFKLHSAPYFIKIFLDLIGGIKYKDYDTITYVKYYFVYIFQIILIRLNLKKYIRSLG